MGSGVLFSAFSKIQEDQTRLRAAYMKIILTLSLVCFPVFSGLFVVAPSVIYVCFGEKWLPSAVPLQILCIAGILRMYLQITSTAINAMGYVATEVWHERRCASSIGCWMLDWKFLGDSGCIDSSNTYDRRLGRFNNQLFLHAYRLKYYRIRLASNSCCRFVTCHDSNGASLSKMVRRGD